jgi:nucleotide-binding universal stress UspA family protein
MKTVLAPIDFSDISDRVIEEAITVARAIGARLVLLNIVQPPAVLTSEYAETDMATEFCTRAERDSASRLVDLQKRLRDAGVTAHAVHQVGPPGQRIVEQAQRLDADYIVIGSHGHGAFYDLLVGSTTTRILRSAGCPIVVVPATPEPAAAGDAPEAAAARR